MVVQIWFSVSGFKENKAWNVKWDDKVIKVGTVLFDGVQVELKVNTNGSTHGWIECNGIVDYNEHTNTLVVKKAK